jgi:hypothetical protein
MCALAARLGDGPASREEMRMAERLIMALVNRLPADSILDVGERSCGTGPIFLRRTAALDAVQGREGKCNQAIDRSCRRFFDPTS